MNKFLIIFASFLISFTLTGCSDLGIQIPMSEPTPEVELDDQLAPAESSAREILQELFVQKYPKYADTLSVRLNQETLTHARGGVTFVEGAPGGYFFADRKEDQWKIVLEGNGQISCTLLSEHGFPSEMMFDCAQ